MKADFRPQQPMLTPGDLAKGKKIVVLIGAFVRTGSHRQAYLLARELRNRFGLDVEVWALVGVGDCAREFEAAGIPIRAVDFWRPMPYCDACGRVTPRPVRLTRWVTRLSDVAKQLRAHGVDVLLPFGMWQNIVAGLTYRFGGVRLCIWGERHAGLERVPRIEKFVAGRYRHFVANSTAGVDFLTGELGVRSERISLVPNGVDVPKASAGSDWRARLEVRPSQPLAVNVAPLSESKDHATLLRAWKIVQDEWPHSEKPFLALAGAFEDAYPSCQKLVRQAGLGASVRFLDSIPEVSELIAASDIGVLSSTKEGMPNAVLEYMAGGKAVIASDLPGVRAAMGPNTAEYLIQPGDARAFASRILELLANAEKRQALGDANRNRVRSEFTAERMAKGHLQAIEMGLGKVRMRASIGVSLTKQA